MAEQHEPIEEGSDEASRREKIDGVLVQVRGDLAIGAVTDADAHLLQRLRDAAIDVSEDELDALRRQLRDGGSSDLQPGAR